jgi:probable rRNA maturation factor
MNDARVPSDPLAVELAVPCAEWRRRIPDLEDMCRLAAEATIVAADAMLGGCEISLVLTDDASIQILNRRWRGQDKPTNVLSFPAQARRPAPEAPLLLGDVIVAYETASCEARNQAKPLEHHLRHLIVHGVLHLLGYDHEEDSQAEKMEALEALILSGLGVPDPYRTPEPLLADGTGHGPERRR